MNQINFTPISNCQYFNSTKSLHNTYYTSLLHSKQKIILVRADKAEKDEFLMDREHFVCTCISLYSKDL